MRTPLPPRKGISGQAVLVTLGNAPQMTGTEVEMIVADLTALADKDNSLSLEDLTGLVAKYKKSPHIAKILEKICEARRKFPGFKERRRFACGSLESVVRWYERKVAHRTMLISYSENLDAISKDQLYNYVDGEVVRPLLQKVLSNAFLEQAYSIVCSEGIFASLRNNRNFISVQGRIAELLASTMLDEIDEGVHLSIPENDSLPVTNWFTRQNTRRIFEDFKEAQEIEDSLLSKEDLLNAHGGCLNDVFVHGFWENAYLFPRTTQDGKKENGIDFRGYVVFQRILFNITTYNGLRGHEPTKAEYTPVLCFVFRCLTGKKGFWTLEDFETIIHGLKMALERIDAAFGAELHENFLYTQMFDFLQPKNPDRIVFDDFLNLDKTVPAGRSSMASLLLGCLIDASKYVEYDSRDGQ